jgi:agmatinase
MALDPNQFFGLPPAELERADAVILPLPVEKTVSYGTGTSGGPRAILDASLQLETFDEETLVDFAVAPRLHTLPPISAEGSIEDCLRRIQQHVRPLRGKFPLALGGEHSVTYGLVMGLAVDPADVTVVQIDAHADLADDLHGRHWSHGTVMRRLCEQGCRLLQIGVRSLTRSEHDFATRSPRIATRAPGQPGKSPWVG